MCQGVTRKRIGALLIFLGVLAWAPYFYLQFIGEEVTVTPFLAAHLSGVLPGFVLRRWDTLRELGNRLFGRKINKSRS